LIGMFVSTLLSAQLQKHKGTEAVRYEKRHYFCVHIDWLLHMLFVN
jgi:hypothetical protein